MSALETQPFHPEKERHDVQGILHLALDEYHHQLEKRQRKNGVALGKLGQMHSEDLIE
jgi:hypothetical protein